MRSLSCIAGRERCTNTCSFVKVAEPFRFSIRAMTRNGAMYAWRSVARVGLDNASDVDELYNSLVSRREPRNDILTSVLILEFAKTLFLAPLNAVNMSPVRDLISNRAWPAPVSADPMCS